MKKKDLTRGPVLGNLLLFALPMMAGNFMQQIYNIVDTLIVGRYVGSEALAGVGSAYTLMTFLTSLIIGLCMGSGALFSMDHGADRADLFKKDVWLSFLFIGAAAILLFALSLPFVGEILSLLSVPTEVRPLMFVYVRIILFGLGFTFFFNFFAYLSRSVGNSMLPLYVLALSSVVNIILDLVFVLGMGFGVAGAAYATVISQGLSAFFMTYSAVRFYGRLLPGREDLLFDGKRFLYLVQNDLFTALQQSVMNFGILMIQGLVNSFGTVIMAAFAAAVKIDTLAYMPAQEFGSAYSLFISQNYGADKTERIREGTKKAVFSSGLFCLFISLIIRLFAANLMAVFVKSGESAVISEGVRYLNIEGSCYMGIGILFLLYGYFRGIAKPWMSLVLTIISLGSRVAIAYSLSGHLGVSIIWWAIPIGWGLADLSGFLVMALMKRKEASYEAD